MDGIIILKMDSKRIEKNLTYDIKIKTTPNLKGQKCNLVLKFLIQYNNKNNRYYVRKGTDL
jgi:hypothetical protein